MCWCVCLCATIEFQEKWFDKRLPKNISVHSRDEMKENKKRKKNGLNWKWSSGRNSTITDIWKIEMNSKHITNDIEDAMQHVNCTQHLHILSLSFFLYFVFCMFCFGSAREKVRRRKKQHSMVRKVGTKRCKNCTYINANM